MSWGAIAVAGVTAAAKVGHGLHQKNKAKKLKKSNFMPAGLKEAKAEADLAANATKAPGQEQAEETVRQNTAQMISNASKVGGGANAQLNIASAAAGNQNKAMRDIASRALWWKDQQRASRNMIRGQMAGQERENLQQFQATKSALLGAANANIWGGISDAGAAGAMAGNKLFSKSSSMPTSSGSGFNTNSFSTVGAGGFNPNAFSATNYNPNAFSARRGSFYKRGGWPD